MLLLILLYSSFCSEASSGAPLASYQLLHLAPREPDTTVSVDTNYRSTAEIIWTCLATTFMCTWVSVHPNVSQGSRWWDNMRDRLILFGWTLLAPELVLVFAYRQWEGVRLLRKLHGEEWGRVQCHFIQMGGVVISHEGQVRPIELSKVEEKKLDEVIDRSRVVEAEILDRSKGDELSKGLVVIQTTWFIICCCARAIQKLTITNLEVITLAYAALNGMMYFFWWDKPLNVRLPVEVEVKDKNTFDRVSREEKSEKGLEGERAFLSFSVIEDTSTYSYKTLASINKILILLYIPARIILVNWSKYVPHV
ncbi:hypothetical protein H1R20_g8042, partial [Candolleomyces eurysporus]